MTDPHAIEAKHYLRDLIAAAIDDIMAKPGATSWDVADALFEAGEVTWNYKIYPEPMLATFQLILTATDADAEPASGGVVEPSGPVVQLTAVLDLPHLGPDVASLVGIETGNRYVRCGNYWRLEDGDEVFQLGEVLDSEGPIRVEPSGPLTAEEADHG